MKTSGDCIPELLTVNAPCFCWVWAVKSPRYEDEGQVGAKVVEGVALSKLWQIWGTESEIIVLYCHWYNVSNSLIVT